MRFMPIVKFQVGQQYVEFKDWMGTSVALTNVRVTVLYDPEKPSLAMIDPAGVELDSVGADVGSGIVFWFLWELEGGCCVIELALESPRT